MKFADILALQSPDYEFNSYHVYSLTRVIQRLDSNSDIWYRFEGSDNDTDNKIWERARMKCHYYEYVDGDRDIQISSIWFDGKPVIFTARAGKDPEIVDFVLDQNLYLELISFLKQFLKPEDPPAVSTEEDILNCNFYGLKISDYFQETK